MVSKVRLGSVISYHGSFGVKALEENTHRRGRITVCLVSSVTGLESVFSVHKNLPYFLVFSNQIQLNWRQAVQ